VIRSDREPPTFQESGRKFRIPNSEFRIESRSSVQVIVLQHREQHRLAIFGTDTPILLDLGLPDISGLEVIRTIRQHNTSVRIVVLSMHSRREYVVPAIEAGCDGYVPKSSTHTSLLQAIRSVLAGEGYLHPTAAKALMGSIQDTQSESAQFEALSEREQDVIRLTAQGFTSREIGEKLDISSKTVETYRQRATEKLQIENRSGLVKFAVRAGLLDDFKSSEE